MKLCVKCLYFHRESYTCIRGPPPSRASLACKNARFTWKYILVRRGRAKDGGRRDRSLWAQVELLFNIWKSGGIYNEGWRNNFHTQPACIYFHTDASFILYLLHILSRLGIFHTQPVCISSLRCILHTLSAAYSYIRTRTYLSYSTYVSSYHHSSTSFILCLSTYLHGSTSFILCHLHITTLRHLSYFICLNAGTYLLYQRGLTYFILGLSTCSHCQAFFILCLYVHTYM